MAQLRAIGGKHMKSSGIGGQAVIEGIMTVSYTHLDVYKRQNTIRIMER